MQIAARPLRDLPAGIDMGLSPRQWQVMIRRARGMTVKEIAHDLGLSEQTVKTHSSNAYEALGAMNIAEAFIALGWLRVPEDEPQAMAA
jgi:DNA-binding NarL/FixJ family response regulator